MNKHDADKMISSYIKKLFGFAMSRLSKIDEAEELAAEITIQVYESLLRQDSISNPDGYIWRVAKNVYARYIDGRKKITYANGIEQIPDSRDFTQELIDSESYGILRREITYLSKLQREIIVQHYFHDKKVREIAELLSLNENTVKWHLACSRKELKMGMQKVRTTGNLGAEPIRFYNIGHSGSVGKNGDTAAFLSKSLTQNIVYAAYHQPRNINEIAEELGVNPIFVEDEVAVLEEYGFMDRQKDGRYLANIQITIPSKEADDIQKEINPKYAKIFAEKFYAPVLQRITDIPDFMKVPDNDLNLLKWAMVVFLSHKLGVAEITNKYAVKRPDGGDYQANASLLNEYIKEKGAYNKYWYCGDMWHNHYGDGIWWESWQFDCEYTDRSGFWTDNLTEDYDKLYYFLTGNLPENTANIESYQRLLDKGYLIKENGGYKVNMILCDSGNKWRSSIPNPSEEIIGYSKEYAQQATKAGVLNQPKHMHEQIKYCLQNSAQWLHTQVMELLVEMGVLTMPTPEQKKGLLTIMFMGE